MKLRHSFLLLFSTLLSPFSFADSEKAPLFRVDISKYQESKKLPRPESPAARLQRLVYADKDIADLLSFYRSAALKGRDASLQNTTIVELVITNRDDSEFYPGRNISAKWQTTPEAKEHFGWHSQLSYESYVRSDGSDERTLHALKGALWNAYQKLIDDMENEKVPGTSFLWRVNRKLSAAAESMADALSNADNAREPREVAEHVERIKKIAQESEALAQEIAKGADALTVRDWSPEKVPADLVKRFSTSSAIASSNWLTPLE